MNKHQKRLKKLMKNRHNDLVCSNCIYWVRLNYIDGKKPDTLICLKRIESQLRVGIMSDNFLKMQTEWMMESHQTACLDFIER